MLLTAHRKELAHHEEVKSWLVETLNAPAAHGVSDLVLSGFIRVVTHPRVFVDPTPVERALQFAALVRESPSAVRIGPRDRHWEIFHDLCREANATGNRVPDAYLAALAIESGSEWITMDRGFARFPGLSWRHPLD